MKSTTSWTLAIPTASIICCLSFGRPNERFFPGDPHRSNNVCAQKDAGGVGHARRIDPNKRRTNLCQPHQSTTAQLSTTMLRGRIPHHSVVKSDPAKSRFEYHKSH